MNYQAVMFDLDGTLADTLTDLAEAANHVLQRLGRPTHPREAYQLFVGRGVDRLFVDALGPEHASLANEAVAMFRPYYQQHMYDATTLYPGIEAMLDALVERNQRLAVLSNKPHAATVLMVERMLGRWPFEQVRGQADGTPPKPDTTSAMQITRAMDIPPRKWIYVGDSEIDMLTGKAAGFFTVGVCWGFRPESELREAGADALIHSADELLQYVA